MARSSGAVVTVTHDLAAVEGADVICADASGGGGGEVAAFLQELQARVVAS